MNDYDGFGSFFAGLVVAGITAWFVNDLAARQFPGEYEAAIAVCDSRGGVVWAKLYDDAGGEMYHVSARCKDSTIIDTKLPKLKEKK